MRILALLAIADAPAFAQELLRDPWVPPHAQRSATYVESHGEALRAQVERKLRAQFDAADVAKAGYLTRAQAQAAGLGYIAENFDAIDRSRAGFVRFEDVKGYLEEASATSRDAARAGPGAAR